MNSTQHPNATITFMIEYRGKFILIERASTEKNFPGQWAFPGGKVEIGETGIDTIVREVHEELGLSLTDEAAFLNSYFFGESVGFAFLVRAVDNNVRLAPEIVKYRWVSSLDDLREFSCISGIYNHLDRAREILSRKNFDSLKAMNLTPDVYINR